MPAVDFKLTLEARRGNGKKFIATKYFLIISIPKIILKEMHKWN